MGSPDIQRIMQTCPASKANEVLLVAGRPPLLRFFSEGVRTFHIEPLTPEDVITLVIDSMIPLDVDGQRMRAFLTRRVSASGITLLATVLISGSGYF